MKRFQYLSFSEYQGITLKSTDNAILKLLSTEIVEDGVLSYTPKMSQYTLKIGSNKEEVEWWLLRKLCEKGWEPFAIRKRKNRRIEYHFRQELVG